MSGLLDSGGGGGSFDSDDTDDTTTHTEETYTGGLVDEESDSTDDSSGTTFDPDEDTLGTDFGEFTDGDDEEIIVEEPDSDTGDSSPAGGAGIQEATERFTNAEDGALDDASRDELLDEAQEASDAYSDGESYEGAQNDQSNQSDDAGDGIAANVDAKKAVAAAAFVGLLAFRGN